MTEQYFDDSQHRFMTGVTETLIACRWEDDEAHQIAPDVLTDWEYAEDTIGSADLRDPSPNDIEECRGNYEAELMALPGSNRRAALDGYRTRNE